MRTDAQDEPGPLNGLRVVEIAGGVSAAFCARQLRGFGAETIRLEGIGALNSRADGPPDVSGETDQLTEDQRVFLVSGAKRVVVSGPDAPSLVADVLQSADVIIEDQGPGFLASLGFDPAQLSDQHRGTIVTSLSPLGHTGPRAHWEATNAVQFALGGLMSLTGDPDRPPLVTGGDQALFLGGLHGWAATLMALVGRARTGHGSWIDLSMQEAAASMAELYSAQSEYELGEPVPRAGNSVRAVWGVYPCADGYAGVCCLERQVGALFALIGPHVADEPRFADAITRADHDDELLAYVMSFMSEATKDELTALSPIHRVPFGAVRTPNELLGDETYAHRCFFDEVSTPSGVAVMPGRPFPGLGWVGPDRLDPPTQQPSTWSSPGWATIHPEPNSASENDHTLLDGLRVVDLTMMWAGPYATKLMAEAGAEIIKIESPNAWDNIRTLIPQDPSIEDPWNRAYYFNEYNHSKKSLTLDLAEPAGREALLRLVATADVVVENYRADVLDNLGLGYDVLRQAKDDIILISMAGFGKTGPLASHVGFGPIIEMMSGLMSLSGYGDDDVPYKTGVSYGDPVGGLNAVAATGLAVLRRSLTGRGLHIDLAQRETASTMAGPAFVAASLRDDQPVHRGNRDPRFVPQGCYPAAGQDRWVVISVRSDAEWAALAHMMGQSGLAHLTHAQRTERHDEIDSLISGWTTTLAGDDVASLLQTKGVPAAQVTDTFDIHDDPQLVSRNFYRTVPNPKMKSYRQTGPTWRINGPRPHEMQRSPWFGEHNDEILTELGFDPAEIGRLRQAEIVADSPINPLVG